MADTFAFDTDWGTRYDPAGTRFRVWAPSAGQIDLAHERSNGRTYAPMSREEGGWWSLVTDEMRPGAGYGFRVDGALVPDPAARAQQSDVHGLSRLVEPQAYRWRTAAWTGRPWHECVFLEIHVGTFTPSGTFDAIIEKLDYLKETGITALEILPVAQFTGGRGWGYDGVLLYCPHAAYGGAEGLKRLVDAAHERGLMVFLDVVYNHFGPDGNYIPGYIPEFFHADVQTAWGSAIAYDETPVRDFMIQNALYWLDEYRLDGLRLDAIDSIKDTTDTPLVKELAERVRATITDRHVHIMTEDDRNISWHIEREKDGSIPRVSGEWNDDFHHCAHVLATGEREGYYGDYEVISAEQIATALASGFVYQGEHSEHRKRDVGVSSVHLPPTAFVNFIQNHDQIGNRAFGDRLRSLASARSYDCLQTILLLAPQIPLMFQGDEFGDCNSFCFFTDFHGELAEAVSKGRKAEFASFAAFEDPQAAEVFPDPNDPVTFEISRVDWTNLRRPVNRRRHQVTQTLLGLRREIVFPLLENAPGDCGSALVDGRAFCVAWTLAPGKVYHCFANLSDETWDIEDGLLSPDIATASEVYANHKHTLESLKTGSLPPYSVIFAMSDDFLIEAFKDD